MTIITSDENNEPTVLTASQVETLFDSLKESYTAEQIKTALNRIFKMGYLEKNQLHFNILEIVRNAESDDQVGKQLSDCISDVLFSKAEEFQEVLFSTDLSTEILGKSIGKVRRSG